MVGVANKTRKMVDWFDLLQTDLPLMTATYLETLNREQRRAVEHGVQKKNAAPGAALLVIAGAGSGKTNTMAHRVAHLMVNGADPRRILLMTFSRRAAAEMTRLDRTSGTNSGEGPTVRIRLAPAKSQLQTRSDRHPS